MRYALRNKGKIEKALGSSFLNLLIASLKKYAKSRSTYITENIDGHKAIRIESHNKKDVYVFVVLSQVYDVVHIAFYKKE